MLNISNQYVSINAMEKEKVEQVDDIHNRGSD